jgi:1-acyl-sn-glycerol-3-phosphate acyltransferase
MDPFILGLPISQRMLRGPGKVELFENPVFGWVLRKLGIFPIRQDVADAAAVRTMVELYRSGGVVVVYPEGGRSETGELQPFFPEFARLAIKLKAPLVPAGIAGGRELLPIGAWIPRYNSPVAVVYGPPFELSEFYGQPLTEDIGKQAAAIMEQKVSALVAEAREQVAAMS